MPPDRKTVSLFPGQELLVRALEKVSSFREPKVLNDLFAFTAAHIDEFSNARGKRHGDLLDLALNLTGKDVLVDKLTKAGVTPEQAEKKLRKSLTAAGSSLDEAKSIAEYVVSSYLKLR